MGKYVLVSRVAMLNGKEVQPIEVRDDGVEIYPHGTVIQMVMREKGNATAKSSCLPKMKSHEPEVDCFENNYGFDRLAKQMQDYKDREYLRKQHYWYNTEEGLQRLEEIRRPFAKIEQPNAFGNLS